MNYIIGKITYSNNNYIIVENSFQGHTVYVANPNEYEVNKYKKLYIYERNLILTNMILKEWFGFPTIKEKILFEKLNKISGIGPRTALSILSHGIDNINHWILTKNFESFKLVKGLNSKLIKVIFDEIQIEETYENSNITKNINDTIEALKSLGYSLEEINNCISSMEKNQFIFKDDTDLSTLLSNLIKNINDSQTT